MAVKTPDNRRTGFCGLVFTLLLAPQSTPAGDELFLADVERILEIAEEAVYDAHPELPADDLLLEHGLSIACFPTHLAEKFAALSDGNQQCGVQIDFVLRSTLREVRHLDGWGACKPSTAGEQVMVQLRQDGSLNGISRHDWLEGGGRLRECGRGLEPQAGNRGVDR